MVQSGYSYCNSTSTRKPSLKVKRVRLRPGCTSPSTVHTLRFSFRSFVMILPFAPRRTCSTFVMESFQWNPKGGGMSSRARAGRTEISKATELAQKNHRFPILFLIPRKELVRISGAATGETNANWAATSLVREGWVNFPAHGICKRIRGNAPRRFFVKCFLIREQK